MQTSVRFSSMSCPIPGKITASGNIGFTEKKILANFPADFRYMLSVHGPAAVAMVDADVQASGKPIHVHSSGAACSSNAMGSIPPGLFVVFRNREYAILPSYTKRFAWDDAPGGAVNDPPFLPNAVKQRREHGDPCVLQNGGAPACPALWAEPGPKTQRETTGK